MLRPLPFAVLLAVLAFLARGSSEPAAADFPHPGLNFAISSGSLCSTAAGSSTCNVPTGNSFTVQFRVTSLPSEFLYSGYDSFLIYSGVTLDEASLVQEGGSAWPDCGFAASDFSQPDELVVGCAIGVGAEPSSFTGVLYHVDFQCPAEPNPTASVMLVNGASDTNLIDPTFVAHGELDDEILTINCGGTPSLAGDVNCDTSVNPIDAALILQFGAGLVGSLACQPEGDVNLDGSVNAIDAALVLQFVAGLLPVL